MAHENVTFNENGTITAIPVHPLTWVPELSNGTEDDILVLPNIALLVSNNFVCNMLVFSLQLIILRYIWMISYLNQNQSS